MYKEKQKLKKADKVALSSTGKTLAFYCKKENTLKIYKLFNNQYELDKKFSLFNMYDIAITDSLLIASHAFKNEVYIYSRKNNQWIKQGILRPHIEDCEFGYLVAISNDNNTAVVEASYEIDIDYDNDTVRKSGCAYVFTQKDNVWTQQAELIATDKKGSIYFGSSIAISSDSNTIIIGDWGDNNYRGSAYIFVRSDNKWTQQAKLLATDGINEDRFGYSVAISSDGNTVIVGAIGDDEFRGSAYIFTRNSNSWIQQAKLIATDREIDDWFGSSVAISSDGSIAIVGANYNNADKRTNSGSVYIFTRSGNTWIQRDKLLAINEEIDDVFGYSVTISNDSKIIIVGTRKVDNDKNINCGSVYVFTLNDSL